MESEKKAAATAAWKRHGLEVMQSKLDYLLANKNHKYKHPKAQSTLRISLRFKENKPVNYKSLNTQIILALCSLLQQQQQWSHCHQCWQRRAVIPGEGANEIKPEVQVSAWAAISIKTQKWSLLCEMLNKTFYAILMCFRQMAWMCVMTVASSFSAYFFLTLSAPLCICHFSITDAHIVQQKRDGLCGHKNARTTKWKITYNRHKCDNDTH